ncbi:hypothetical protein IAQ61_005833 [Plenodomus lingam]|uniref:uncharacterized protein n=1 Tax=Leptosphaeria maculans TaxID=5022 RepID=UPI003326FC14|nr:hypothetical protein IAQ61_005833 [Plenodomus lingam]
MYRIPGLSDIAEGKCPPCPQFLGLQICSKPQQVRIEGAMSVEALSLDDPTEEIKHEHSVNSSPASKNPCRPLSQWDCLSPRGVPNGLVMRSESVVNQPASTQSNPHEPNQYQRLIRRMESASSKIVLDRLKEDWSTSGQIDDEVSFLRHSARSILLIQMIVDSREAAMAPHRVSNARLWQASGCSETAVRHRQGPGAIRQRL